MSNSNQTQTAQEFVHNPEFDAYQAVKQFMAGQPIHEANTSDVSWYSNGGIDYLMSGADLIASFHQGEYELQPWSDHEEARRVKGILLSLIRKYGLKFHTVWLPRGIESADNAADGFEARKEQIELEETITRTPRGKKA